LTKRELEARVEALEKHMAEVYQMVLTVSMGITAISTLLNPQKPPPKDDGNSVRVGLN